MRGILLGAAFGSGLLLTIRSLQGIPEIVHRKISRIPSRLHHMRSSAIGVQCAGGVFGLMVSLLLRVSWSTSLVFFAAGFGVSHLVSSQVKEQALRKQRFFSALLTPAFLDLLALLVSTGVPLRQALQESLRRTDSVVTQSWKPLLEDDEISIGLVQQLDHISRSTDDSVQSRIANALMISTERGTPVHSTLQSLSGEIRSENRRRLFEIAARKDIQMMLPVVFGILPSITVIALYPAFSTLTTFN